MVVVVVDVVGGRVVVVGGGWEMVDVGGEVVEVVGWAPWRLHAATKAAASDVRNARRESSVAIPLEL